MSGLNSHCGSNTESVPFTLDEIILHYLLSCTSPGAGGNPGPSPLIKYRKNTTEFLQDLKPYKRTEALVAAVVFQSLAHAHTHGFP